MKTLYLNEEQFLDGKEMLNAVKIVARAILPTYLHPHNLARTRVLRRSGGRVIAGLFAGQIYITSEEDLIESAMLMGTYERELHSVVERMIQKPPHLFIDVGASQGDYSVGFARRLPHVRNIAFEMHEPSLAQLHRTAAANGVQDRIEIWGACTPAKLQEALSLDDLCFMIVDVEGYENVLMDLNRVPLLAQTTVLVEMHDHYVPNITKEIIRRFSATHKIETLNLRPRTARDLPFVVCDQWTLRQIDEGRSRLDQKWLFMTPYSLHNGANDCS